MRKSIIKALEFTVFSFIVLVIIQTVFEDLSLLLDWETGARRLLVVTGFIFDLFFTIEFLVRLYWAIVEHRVSRYFLRERGWVDFLASVPLLMFNSGPALLALFTGGSLLVQFNNVLNILKVLKAVRIARILRFLRVIKIFKNIKYTESPMAQRHIARITSLTVTAIVIILFVFTTVSGFLPIPGAERLYTNAQRSVVRLADRAVNSSGASADLYDVLKEMNTGLLRVSTKNNDILYSRYSDTELNKHYMQEDIIIKTNKQETLFFMFDNKPVQQDLALQDLLILSIIVIVMACFLFIYSPHFALTVTDPLHVMKQGMENKDYNLEVKILKKYEQDDVFRLAADYNEQYLPLKDRELHQEPTPYSELRLEDVQL
jgi:hypothetical protein